MKYFLLKAPATNSSSASEHSFEQVQTNQPQHPAVKECNALFELLVKSFKPVTPNLEMQTLIDSLCVILFMLKFIYLRLIFIQIGI